MSFGDVLGAGGFAVAWSATRAADGAPVVAKVGRASAPVMVERFRREAEAMERIGPPHVPALYAYGRLEGGAPYLVMERLFGCTLGEHLGMLPGPPGADWVAQISDRLLGALAAAHAEGVVHRDLKPENVFLADGGERVVLLDFGLVKRLDGQAEELTRSGVAVGTPEYMAPEQIQRGAEVGAPADLYAIGVILYEMLTSRPPFVGEGGAVVHGHLVLRPPRPSAFVPVPPALEEVVLSCLAKEPARRPASAAALRQALSDAALAAAPPSRGAAQRARGSGLLEEGRPPVVLLVLDTDGEASAVVEAVQRRGGSIARQRGQRFVAVFNGLEVDAPAQVALSAARELAAAPGARAALHLAQVTARRRAAGPAAVFGAAVDRPESWMPAEPWGGLWLSEEVSRALPVQPASELECPGGVEQGASPSASAPKEHLASPPLFGREAAIEALTASARVAFAQGSPSLVTLIGDDGIGKSRLCLEAAEVARRLEPGALVVALEAQALAGEVALAEELARGLGAVAPARGGRWLRALVEALRRRAREGRVAVILDDAHWASGEVLDALEVATLDGADLPLWVVVTAHPRFEAARPSWGARTRWHARVQVEPLEEAAAMQLAAELLKPAEYPPAAVLERLARWSAGNPSSLAETVRALKRAGVVRLRPGTQSYYVATADMDALPASPSRQWLSARRLGGLSPELSALARLCAVLGLAFRREEVEWVQDALERVGAASTSVDAGFGLRALAEERILEPREGDRHAFQSALFQGAVYESLEPAQRAAAHEQALAYGRWRLAALEGAGEAGLTAPGREEALTALARHALAVGARDEAADALIQLGDGALGRHRYVEADQRYTAALAATSEGDARRRVRALGGRGRSRVALSRPKEACEDLEAARRHAAEIGDTTAVAELLLEEATALDWAQRFEDSAQRVEQARPLVEAAGSGVLGARLLVADGRTAYRRAQADRALSLLREGLAAAIRHRDYSAQVIALVLLVLQLPISGLQSEAEACFDDVIELTRGANDMLHMCVAVANRTHLWLARGDYARAVEDMQQAVALARQIGSPRLEHQTTATAAELLFSGGVLQEALTLARRVRMLEERFMDGPTAFATQLLARILLETGALAEARALVEEVTLRPAPDLLDSSQAPSLQAELRMLQLLLSDLQSGAGSAELEPAWDQLIRDVERLLAQRAVYPDQLLEVLYWRGYAELRRGQHRDVARTLSRATPDVGGSPGWHRRIERLRATLCECGDAMPVVSR